MNCSWRPAARGLHLQRAADGTWRADWPEHERYDLGPPSIAWITWHTGFWWSMVLDHTFGTGTLTRESVTWPGTADGVRKWLGRLRGEWLAALDNLSDADFASPPADALADSRSAVRRRRRMGQRRADLYAIRDVRRG